jgi:Flp pilus assembly protein TadG
MREGLMARVFKKTALTLASLAARNCTSNDDGAVLVESAIVLPVMVLVILGGLDLGLGMLAATRLNFATESAAKCGALAVPGCTDAASTAAFAAAQSSAPASAFSVTQVSYGATQGGMEQVSASYAYSFQFLPWTITLQSSASYPITPPSS